MQTTKQRIKQLSLLIILSFFFGISLTSCEKDLYEVPLQQQNKKFTYLKGKEALDVTSLLAEKMGVSSDNIKNRGLEVIDYGTIKYDVVMKVVDSLGNKTFTFNVDHSQATDKKFYNMVLQQKIDGLTMVKFYEYNMTPEFAEKYNSGEKKIKDFEGTYDYRLVSYVYDTRDGNSGDGEYGGGGGSGDGGYSGGGTNDGNTGSPTGGTPYDPMSGNTSSGVGSIGSGGGSPCPQGGGGIGGGSGSGPGSGAGGGTGGGSGGSTGSSSSCTTTTITVLCNGGGGHTGESTCNGTNHGYMIQITICSGGSNRGVNDADPCGSGSGGAGGNSSGVGILEPPIVPPTPCDQVKKLGEPTKNNIKPNVDLLKQKVNSSNNKKEIGFESQKNTNYDDTISYTNTDVSSPNQFNISLNTGGPYIGGGHSHPDGSDPMFSYGDLKFLSKAYNDASSSRKEDVFYIVVCKNPNTGFVNTYCIRVDDIAILDTSIDAIWTDPIYANISELNEARINKIHYDQAKTYSKCGGDFEKSFLQQFSTFGISLFEATDNTMTKWSKIELDANPNNPVIKTPCN